MSDIDVVLVHADAREERTVATGTKAWELFAETPDVIAARVDGTLRDLAHELGDGDEVEGVAIDSADGRDILRHSTAHVMAQAVQDLFPDAKLGHRSADRERLLLRLRRRDPVRARGPREDRDPDAQDHQGEPAVLPPAVSDDDAREELAEEPYKLELIGLKGSARGGGGRRERRGRCR